MSPKRKKYTFREALSVKSVGKVDRANNTIHDVRVCGLQSGNGRRYSSSALLQAISLYEGAKVFFDHPEGKSNTRKFGERFGRLVNVREADDGGLIANLKYNPNHPRTESFLWFAENDPGEMGLSHNAQGTGIREASGDILVDQITKVFSVDIVDGPATTYSLFEQDFSMNDEIVDPATEDATTDDTGAATDIDALLAELVKTIAAHPEWTKEEKLAKIQDAVMLMGEPNGDEEDGEEGDDAEMPDDKMMEQLKGFRCKAVKSARVKLLRESRRQLAKSKGIKEEAITAVFLEQLTTVSEPKALQLIADRKSVSTASKAKDPKATPSSTGAAMTPAEIAASIKWN